MVHLGLYGQIVALYYVVVKTQNTFRSYGAITSTDVDEGSDQMLDL